MVNFNQRVKANSDTWKFILSQARVKDSSYAKSVKTGICLERETKVKSKELIRKKVEETEIKDIDFFKTVFWGEPIPERKIDKIIEINTRKREQSHTHNKEHVKEDNQSHIIGYLKSNQPFLI